MATITAQVRRNLLILVDAYCAATGFSRSTTSRKICGKGSLVADLKAGRCCVSPGRFDLMLVRAAKMWPKGAPLPKFVPMTITLPIRGRVAE